MQEARRRTKEGKGRVRRQDAVVVTSARVKGRVTKRRFIINPNKSRVASTRDRVPALNLKRLPKHL